MEPPITGAHLWIWESPVTTEVIRRYVPRLPGEVSTSSNSRWNILATGIPARSAASSTHTVCGLAFAS